MQQLELNKESDAEISPALEAGFWKRQFQTQSTGAQRKFDWLFGVILPVICFACDPIVFKGFGMGKGALLGNYKPFAYLLSFSLIMGMAAWLIWGAKLKWLNAFLAGLFLVGGITSLGIGVVLIPFSLLGLIVLIGILGFTPLLSSVVYLRNAFRTFQISKPFYEKRILVYSLFLSAIFSFVVPYVINVEIKRALDRMIKGDVQTIRSSADRLKYLSPLVNFDSLGGRHCQSPNSEEHQVLAETYQQLTGKNIGSIDRPICEDW